MGCFTALFLLATTSGLLRAPSVRTSLLPTRAILTVGNPYAWPDALDKLSYVREHGRRPRGKAHNGCVSKPDARRTEAAHGRAVQNARRRP